MARLYQKINNEAVPLGGGGGGSVAIDNVTITENSDDEIQVATALTNKINQLNNSASDTGKVLTANGDGTASWDDVLVPIDYETITKNSDGELQVSSMPYDNTASGLEADNVQDAIDEVNDSIDEIESMLDGIGTIIHNKETSSIQITAQSDALLDSKTLTKGIYLVYESVYYPSNFNASIGAYITTSGSGIFYLGSEEMFNGSGSEFISSVNGILVVNTDNMTVEFRARYWRGSLPYTVQWCRARIVKLK